MPPKLLPTEYQEQVTVVDWLDRSGVLYCHVPNGESRNKVTGARLKKLGVKPGVSDLLIFDAPPKLPYKTGTALEMKRRTGGRVSPAQKRWLGQLESRGWIAVVGRGARDAVEKLRGLGYGC